MRPRGCASLLRGCSAAQFPWVSLDSRSTVRCQVLVLGLIWFLGKSVFNVTVVLRKGVVSSVKGLRLAQGLETLATTTPASEIEIS